MKVPHLQHRHIYTDLNGSVLDSRMHVNVYSHSVMPDSLQPVGCQAPLSMGFSRQEYWSWLPLPPPSISLILCLYEMMNVHQTYCDTTS